MGKRGIGLLVLGSVVLLAACTPAATPVVAPTSPVASPTAMSPSPTPTLPSPTATPMPRPAVKTPADVLFVKATQADDGTWTFAVTVRHEDTGWEDYVNSWEVLTMDGQKVGERILLHPHETEQPFTRSQSGLIIPEGVTRVRVRAHELVEGYSGREVVVDLTVAKGQDFEVVG